MNRSDVATVTNNFTVSRALNSQGLFSVMQVLLLVLGESFRCLSLTAFPFKPPRKKINLYCRITEKNIGNKTV